MTLFLAILCDLYMPLLVALSLWPLRQPQAWPRLRSGLLFLALGFALMAIDRVLGIWACWGGDYSTHTAVAAALTLHLWGVELKRRGLLIAGLGLYLSLMKVLGYHTWADMFSTLAALAPGFWLIRRHCVSSG